MFRVSPIWSVCYLLFLSTIVSAQEINFGTYSSSYSMSVSTVDNTSLDFGQLISGDVSDLQILLTDMEVVTLQITGVRYLDVYVAIMAPDYLIEDADPGCVTDNCRVPFTLGAAYANRGTNNTAQAIVFGTTNTASALFPIKYRGNAPPGPPPTPVYEGFDPSLFEEDAYLYIYGTLTAGTYDSGSYTSSSDISVTISYD